MADINYTTVLSLTDESNILLSNPTPPPTTFTAPALEDSTLTNMITGDDYLMTSSQFPTSPLPCTFTLNSVTGGFGATYGDSVYRYDGAIALTDDYITEAYLLVTTAIDAGIPLMPQTTGREIENYNQALIIRAGIQNYFDAENYTDANKYIIFLTNLLTDLSSGGALVPVATLPASVTINTEIADTTSVFPEAFGYYNVLTNTLTLVEYPYTWEFTPNSASPQDNDTTQPTLYPDGVYTDYVSVLCTFDDSGNYPALLNEGTGYLLVTTTVDNQIDLFEANYDPDNTAEAIALAELQSLQTSWIAAFESENYTAANELIAQAQAILANGLSRPLSAALTSDADMTVFFTVPAAMPVGTYTTSTSTITNTLTGVAFTFSGFPADDEDLVKALNSETLGFGADFPDGVYQIVVPFYVDGLLFTGECLLPITTDWQCCIDKAAGKKCGKLNTALMQANLTNAVRMVAVYSDVNTANALISEGNRECSSCGCGCS